MNPNIPKTLHLIWIGPKAPPKQLVSWTRDFAESHRDWAVRVWRDKDIDAMNLVNRDAYGNMKEWCGKADIARYEILFRHGGLYVDADSQWLGRHPHPFTGNFNVFREDNGLLANGVIASVPGHPILRALIDSIRTKFDPKQSAWISTGPKLLTKIDKSMPRGSKATVVDVDKLLCPSNWHGVASDALQTCKQAGEAFAFHWGETTNEKKEAREEKKRNTLLIILTAVFAAVSLVVVVVLITVHFRKA